MIRTIETHMPRAQRDGLVHSLTECLSMLTSDQETVITLYFHVYNKLESLMVEEYDAYCRRWTVDHGPSLYLTEWRAAVAELHEAMQLAEMFGEDPNEKTADLRKRLLLQDGELPKIHGERADVETQERDGMFDGYWAVMSIFREPDNWKYEPDVQVLGPRVSRLLMAAWPHDYLEYRGRFDAFFTDHPCPKGIGPAMEYDEWCECVDKLHALAASCIARGRAPDSSRKYRGMMIKLLRVEGEGAPSAE